MTDTIWIVKKYYRDYESDFNEAAFFTEEEAKDYVNQREIDLEEIISIWKTCRKFDYYPDTDDIEYTEPEQKFLDMTNYDPWDFSYEDEIRYHFEGYSIEDVPLINKSLNLAKKGIKQYREALIDLS